MNSSTVLSCHNLYKSFKEGKLSVDVLRDINFTVNAGERIAIVGPSGSGKSTLLHLLGGLDKPSKGSVHIANTELKGLSDKKRSLLRNRYLGFIYQFHHLLPEFNALENVAIPLLLGKQTPKLAMNKAEIILEQVGLGHRLTHRLGELSGGERQRVAIARALVNQPLCLFADEPTGNLDSKTATQVIELMLALNQQRKTSLIIVTHDMSLAKRMDRIVTIKDGRLSDHSS